MDLWKNTHFKISVGVVSLVLVLVILSKWTASGRPVYNKRFEKQLKSILEQASRWHVTSKQDSNPLISLIHADYAVANANLLRSLAPEEDIQKLTGTNITEFLYLLEEDQKKAVQSVADQCPSVKPEGTYAISSGWI